MQKDGLSNAEFAKKIGISTSLWSHIVNGRNKPSLDVVMSVYKAYPNININWLLYGDGDMEKSDYAPSGEPDLFSSVSENREFAGGTPISIDFRKENASEMSVLPPKESVKEEIRYIEKPQPKITEIRIFFDNGTYQVFKPEK